MRMAAPRQHPAPSFAPPLASQHHRHATEGSAASIRAAAPTVHTLDHAYGGERRGHGRAGTDIEPALGSMRAKGHGSDRRHDNGALASYEAAMNAGMGPGYPHGRQAFADEEEAVERERERLEGIHVGNGHEQQHRVLAMSGEEPAEDPGQDAPLTALDAVLLPVLEQLSLAVAQRPEAQRTIADLRKAITQAERITPGLMNAFAVEVYHGMAEVTAEMNAEEYEDDDVDQDTAQWQQ